MHRSQDSVVVRARAVTGREESHWSMLHDGQTAVYPTKKSKLPHKRVTVAVRTSRPRTMVVKDPVHSEVVEKLDYRDPGRGRPNGHLRGHKLSGGCCRGCGRSSQRVHGREDQGPRDRPAVGSLAQDVALASSNVLEEDVPSLPDPKPKPEWTG